MAVTINGSTGVQLDDNDKQKFGTGDDLEIFHDGSDAYISKTTADGRLQIKGDGIQLKSGSNNFIHCDETGIVELYHNGVKKFETNQYGNKSLQHLYMDDDHKLQLGSSQDLQIYHNGSHSYIEDTGTGQLVIKSDLVKLQGTNGEDYVKGTENGAVEFYFNGVRKLNTQDWGLDSYTIKPYDNDAHDLGSSGYKWDDVYATNGTIQTSDKNEKNTIVDTDLGLSFVNKLKPVSYKFNGKTRTHYGLIAQDVETTLSDISKPTTGFAGFIKEDIPDQLYVKEDEIPEGKKVGDLKKAAYTTYGLRYNEFISPLIKAVQELSAEVETLKTKVATLEAHTHE